MSTDDTRPLPAQDDETRARAAEPPADDETPTRAVEPVAADDAPTQVVDPVRADEATEPRETDADATRPLPAAATRPQPPVGDPAVTGRAAYAPAGSTAAAPAPRPAPEPQTPAGPELRVGTVVWGLVVAVVGIGLVSFAWGARIDGGLALIVLLAGAGVALLVGSLVMAVRRPRRAGRG